MTIQPTIAQPTRRGLLGGGLGLAAAAGGVQLAQFGLGSAPARAQAQAKPVKLAVVAQQMSAQSDQRSWAGFQQWLKSAGLDKSWEVNQIDAKGDPGALESLTRSKTPFFSLDSGWQAPAVADITSNNWVMGGQYTQCMVDRLLGEGKEKAKICAVVANFHHGTRKRGKVMRAVLTENEWIGLNADRVIQYAGFYETTQNVVNDWLARYGNDLDAVWCPWDEPGMAAAEVIKSRNMGDKVFVVSADGHPTALDRMRDASYPLKATTAQAFEIWGAYTGWLINEIVGKGRPAKEVVPVPTVEFPAPLLVSGVNVPAADTPTYEATDLYYIYRDRALSGMKG